MTRHQLFQQIKKKQSFLCVGLDIDLSKIPSFLMEFEDPIFEFNKRIIEATKDFCIAYKPNTAFYEASGAAGWKSLKKTIDYIPDDIFIIADAKRGDIGNTSALYAKAFFENLNCDALTIAPYMGVDSVSPFLQHKNKWAILLGLTSNAGSQDFQRLTAGKRALYEQVLIKSSSWGTPDNLMYVVGATHPQDFTQIRKIIPNHFLLVPGIGAQGGDLEGVAKYGMNKLCGLIVNSSRGIIYAGKGNDFDNAAGLAAKKIKSQMSQLLIQNKIISA